MSTRPHHGRSADSWRLLPAFALRQSGFGFELLEPYAEPDAVAEAGRMADTRRELDRLIPALKERIRQARPADSGGCSSAVATKRPLSAQQLALLEELLAPEDLRTLHAYQRAATGLADSWLKWEQAYEERLKAAKSTLREAFRTDPLLRDALLLSNEAGYQLFAEWLDGPEGVAGPRGRKMTDLLIRYLQRVTTKNETASHFGPLSVGRFDRDLHGVDWAQAPLRRRVFLAAWAAEKLAGALSRDPALAGQVRPRRRPWAFEREGAVTLYEFTTEDGFSADWQFRDRPAVALSAEELAVFRRCDGSTTLARLREELGAGVDAALTSLVERELVVARFEVPVGVTEPLEALREQVGEAAAVERMAADLAAIPVAEPTDRPAAIERLKSTFVETTGSAANRGTGLHYADRSVFYEECHGPVGDVRLGADLAELIEDELAPVYALALAVPRLRILREGEVLSRWAAQRFGSDTAVPLDRFYAAYFEDRPALLRECDRIDAELDGLDAELTDLLLGDADPAIAEIEVAPERLRAFLARCPDGPPALLNPDVMLAAENTEALARGEYLAIVGDCHGTRELLSHSSFAPLMAEEYAGFTEDVTAAYRELVDEDEVLCDLARVHPDKTASRAPLDMVDVEVFGRSSRPREQVVQPSAMYLKVSGGRLGLYAEGVTGRLRLLAPPSGGPSIRLDPLAPFAFARRLGGLLLQADHHAHMPRIRTGRTVLQRRLWRIPVAELAGLGADGSRRKGNAAEFFAACELRARHGLPRHAFVKFDSEPKPLYVDFEAPLLVRQMFRLAHGDTGLATFSEMLPGPDQLWLRRNGLSYTSELRCSVFTTVPEPTVPEPIRES
ncbi:lantibiotic dehydratase family protein [Kitasatospora sp. NBC_00085]|uniref:lantibiotic dehydratase n=1 Tax=unclassified Kitasatospora TaxID=2633591 RepID=UPI00324AEF18